MPHIKAIRISQFSVETYAAIAAAIVVLIGVLIQRSTALNASPKPQQPDSIETVLYQAEAKRLLSEALRLSQTRGSGCFQRGANCVLARMRREAVAQLESSYSSNPNAALTAYMQIRALNTISTLRQSPASDEIQEFIHTQRRTK
ncbi:hypothetical protein [Leptolyngbya sp. GGD]|uniref:hypothetical protein n=1 Tax=Leptolyngbya sp. GGD TaxID=2997907 RepID=UPI00227A2CDD|nr:hypothetical protein [Leptolyngbya sp. GGD]MCY6492323.1 hypothetical protein [Leptolyngbya sp. GGD]